MGTLPFLLDFLKENKSGYCGGGGLVTGLQAVQGYKPYRRLPQDVGYGGNAPWKKEDLQGNIIDLSGV